MSQDSRQDKPQILEEQVEEAPLADELETITKDKGEIIIEAQENSVNQTIQENQESQVNQENQ